MKDTTTSIPGFSYAKPAFPVNLFLLEAGVEYQRLILSEMEGLDLLSVDILDDLYNDFWGRQLTAFRELEQGSKAGRLADFYEQEQGLLNLYAVNSAYTKEIEGRTLKARAALFALFDRQACEYLDSLEKTIAEFDRLTARYDGDVLKAQRARWKRLYFKRKAAEIRAEYAPPATDSLLADADKNDEFGFEKKISNKRKELEDNEKAISDNWENIKQGGITLEELVEKQKKLYISSTKLKHELQRLEIKKDMYEVLKGYKAEEKKPSIDKKAMLYAVTALLVESSFSIFGNDITDEQRNQLILMTSLYAVDLVGTMAVDAFTEGAGGALFHALFNGLVIQAFAQEQKDPTQMALNEVLDELQGLKSDLQKAKVEIMEKIDRAFRDQELKNAIKAFTDTLNANETTLGITEALTSDLPDYASDIWESDLQVLSIHDGQHGFVKKYINQVLVDLYGHTLVGEHPEEVYTNRQNYQVGDTETYLHLLLNTHRTTDIVEVGNKLVLLFSRVIQYLNHVDLAVKERSKKLAYAYYEMGHPNDVGQTITMRDRISSTLKAFIGYYYFNPVNTEGAEKVIPQDGHSVILQINFQLQRSFEEYLLGKNFSTYYEILKSGLPFTLAAKEGEGYAPLVIDRGEVKDEFGVVTPEGPIPVLHNVTDHDFPGFEHAKLMRFDCGYSAAEGSHLFVLAFINRAGQFAPVCSVYDQRDDRNGYWRFNALRFSDLAGSQLEEYKSFHSFRVKFIYEKQRGGLFLSNQALRIAGKQHKLQFGLWRKRWIDRDNTSSTVFFKTATHELYLGAAVEPYTKYVANGTVLYPGDTLSAPEPECGYTLVMSAKSGKLIATDRRRTDGPPLWTSENQDKADFAKIEDGRISLYSGKPNGKAVLLWQTEKDEQATAFFKLQGYRHGFRGWSTLFDVAEPLSYQCPSTKKEITYDSPTLILNKNQHLRPARKMYSADGSYHLSIDQGGNLILRDCLGSTLFAGPFQEEQKTGEEDYSLFLNNDGWLSISKGNDSTFFLFSQTRTKQLSVSLKGEMMLASSFSFISERPFVFYRLTPGTVLLPGDAIYSADRRYRMRLLSGNTTRLIVENEEGEETWDAGWEFSTTYNNEMVTLRLREDGVLAVQRINGEVLRQYCYHHRSIDPVDQGKLLTENVNFLAVDPTLFPRIGEYGATWRFRPIEALYVSEEGKVQFLDDGGKAHDVIAPEEPVFPSRSDWPAQLFTRVVMEVSGRRDEFPADVRIYSLNGTRFLLFDGFKFRYGAGKNGPLKDISPAGSVSDRRDNYLGDRGSNFCLFTKNYRGEYEVVWSTEGMGTMYLDEESVWLEKDTGYSGNKRVTWKFIFE